MNENLTKLAQKIDFSKTDPEDLNGEITEVRVPKNPCVL